MKYLVFVLVLLTGCQSSLPVVKEFDKSGETIELRVHTVKTQRELMNIVPSPKKGLTGQTLYSHGDNVCDLYVVESKTLDSDDVLSLGHELMHCLYGDYHSY